MLKEGDKAPAFALADQTGQLVRSADLAGKTWVVYFYPKDDTPGCTKEACAFRDSQAGFAAKGVEIIGVSSDTIASHLKFAGKFDLKFCLLADTERSLIQAFGAWGEKKMYGKSYEGILRSTFLVGPDGKIRKVWPKVSPETHAAEILAYL